jgi:hypothetical protein
MPASTIAPASRRFMLGVLAVMPALPALFATASARAQTEPLASWNDGPAKQSRVENPRTVQGGTGERSVSIGAFFRARLGRDHLCHSFRYEPGGFRGDSYGMDEDSEASTIQTALQQAYVSTDDRGPGVFAGQRVRDVHCHRRYGIPTQKVIGSSLATKYETKNSKPELIRLPKLFFNDNNEGKAIGIDLFIGKRPFAAFGNSTGDQQMLEYTGAGTGVRLKMLVHHDDDVREYAYGPAGGLPDTKVGTFSQSLMDEAKALSWTVISMKNDWKRIFAFET